MKVVLIQPPWSDTYGRFKEAAKLGCVTAPLGLCYLGAALKENGFSVELLDAESLQLSIEETVDKVIGLKPDLIGITTTTPIFHIARKIAFQLKAKSDIPIVVGGVHITIDQEKSLEECPEFDFGAIGEGEFTLVELVANLRNPGKLKEVKGLMIREGENVIKNPVRAAYESLDEIPFPDRSLLDLSKYVQSLPGKGFVRYADLFTARGCPFECTFCSQHTMYGRKVRYRSLDNVMRELELIVNEMKIPHVIIMDETMTLKRSRTVEFCNEIIKRKLNFTWEGWTHAATVDEELFRLMRKAGLVKISFGIESGNPEILKSIKKSVTLEQIRNAYKYAKNAGIETRGSAILGHPFETRKTAMDTINFVCSIKECDQLFFSIATPYPGTEMWENAVKGKGGMKLLTRDFSKFQRYGDPVIEVNDLKAEDLVNLQRYGLFKFYFTPRKFFYNLKRAGFKAGFKNALAFARSILSKSSSGKKITT